MVAIARDKRETKSSGVRHRTQFHVDDACVMDYPESFYDLVYSRDTILHIEDKLALFKLFYKELPFDNTIFTLQKTVILSTYVVLRKKSNKL